MNFNNLSIPTRSGNQGMPLSNNNFVSNGLAVHFREMEEHAIAYIRKAKAVVGCAAWLTSVPILTALSKVPVGVQIVVQKEDFLRPDHDNMPTWKAKLRSMYGNLKKFDGLHSIGGLASSLEMKSWFDVDSVRCVGNNNRDKNPTCPRMHNKFLVFCDIEKSYSEEEITFEELEDGTIVQDGGGLIECGIPCLKPLAVWTGSFNFTRNATMSFENAIVTSDQKITSAYFEEYTQILALSEPLDWTSDWIAPEWRIGT